MSEEEAINFLSKSKIALTTPEIKNAGFSDSVIGNLEYKILSRKAEDLKNMYHLRVLPSGCNQNSRLFAVREDQYKNWIIEKVFYSDYSRIPISLRMMLNKSNYVETKRPKL
jgi:hypothetical protein